jgi:serine/threonine protein kinase
MAFATGTKLGLYEIQSALGAGGMGEVYRASDTKLGRDVALKVLPAEMARDSERLLRFRREAKTLAQLDHPNIVTIYSVEECEGVHFLTMQLVEGLPLDEVISQNGLPVDQIVEIAQALAEALAAAHEKGIVHRDMKPANVMISDRGRVKVLDFGLAKDIREANHVSPQFPPRGDVSPYSRCRAPRLLSGSPRLPDEGPRRSKAASEETAHLGYTGGSSNQRRSVAVLIRSRIRSSFCSSPPLFLLLNAYRMWLRKPPPSGPMYLFSSIFSAGT